MHPPPFRLQDKLSDWPECVLRLHCCHIVAFPVNLLIQRHGDGTFQKLLRVLRCKNCSRPPWPVYLVATSQQETDGDAPLNWSIELMPRQKPLSPYKVEADENLKQRTRTPFELKVLEQRMRG